MSAPGELCPDSWPLISCSGADGCDHLANLNSDLRAVFETAAVEYLWRWSGRRFGLCETTIRPCAEDCGSWSTFRGWAGSPAGYPIGAGGFVNGMYPIISGGNWFNVICGRCNSQRCGCPDLSTIVLPGPVNSVTAVYIDGDLLDPAAYRLDNLGLSRIDGDTWPKCQDMAHPAIPDESPGESPDLADFSDTFAVVYQRGVPVPAGGQLAAGTLACELAKRCSGDKSCRLPKRATMVVREGVTVQLPSDAELFRTGALGIEEIDFFLASVQQDNRNRFSVLSPDTKRFRSTW
jgi:hypothetical protein